MNIIYDLCGPYKIECVCSLKIPPFLAVRLITQAPVYILTEDDAEDWIDKNQLGRRNLHPDDFKMMVGRRYNRRKGSRGGDHKSKDQNDTLIDAAEVIAQEHGVSPATVKRAVKFEEVE